MQFHSVVKILQPASSDAVAKNDIVGWASVAGVITWREHLP